MIWLKLLTLVTIRISSNPEPSTFPWGTVVATGQVPVGTQTHVWPFVGVGSGTGAATGAAVAGAVGGLTGRFGGNVETGGKTGIACRSSPLTSNINQISVENKNKVCFLNSP